MMRTRTKRVKKDAAGDGEAAVNVLFELWRLGRAAATLISEEALAESELSGDEFGVYSLLSSSEDITPRVLERWMAAPATTVSSYIKRLEARGHISRTIDPSDRRSVFVRLTPAGERAHAHATKQYLPVLQRVVENLGADEPRVRKALAVLREAVTAARSKST